MGRILVLFITIFTIGKIKGQSNFSLGKLQITKYKLQTNHKPQITNKLTLTRL